MFWREVIQAKETGCRGVEQGGCRCSDQRQPPWGGDTPAEMDARRRRADARVRGHAPRTGAMWDLGGPGRADTGGNCRNRTRMVMTAMVMTAMACLESQQRVSSLLGCRVVLFPWGRHLGVELRALGLCVYSWPRGHTSGWVSVWLLDNSCHQPHVLRAANSC